MSNLETKYLERLSELYPTISAASTEIINLKSILNLPKGTEHFLTDIHGEHEAFFHVLKNGSGSVKRKIDEVFGNTLSNKDKKALATLIYYPKEKMKLVERGMMVKVLYYSAGEYVSVEGIVSKIDLDFRKLTVVKTEIDLDDIWDIEY